MLTANVVLDAFRDLWDGFMSRLPSLAVGLVVLLFFYFLARLARFLGEVNMRDNQTDFIRAQDGLRNSLQELVKSGGENVYAYVRDGYPDWIWVESNLPQEMQDWLRRSPRKALRPRLGAWRRSYRMMSIPRNLPRISLQHHELFAHPTPAGPPAVPSPPTGGNGVSHPFSRTRLIPHR